MFILSKELKIQRVQKIQGFQNSKSSKFKKVKECKEFKNHILVFSHTLVTVLPPWLKGEYSHILLD